MTRAIFIFIASLLLVFPITKQFEPILSSTQLLICLPFLLFLGIPHGAIDNILFIQNKELSNAKFILLYLIIVAVNVLAWIIHPPSAYILFLIISAYHFGQSQFSHYVDKQTLLHKTLYTTWGISILMALVLFNFNEVESIMFQHAEFARFAPLHEYNLTFLMFSLSLGLTLGLFIWFYITKEMKLEHLLMELLVLGLILGCFYLLPIVIGFTLYFVILHSFKVLREEFHYLINMTKVTGVVSFIKLITPFTLFSIGGIVFVFLFIHLGVIELSYGYTLMIVISSITLPHVFVMNTFYLRLFKNGIKTDV